MEKQTRQYGIWPSPISARMLAESLTLTDVQWDSDGETLIWHERRGKLGVLVMQRGTNAPYDLTGDLSVLGRVGYGGGDFTVHGGFVYFAGPGGRQYRQALAHGGARPLTPAFGEAAAPAVSPDGKWLVFVHSYEGTDGLAIVDTAGAYWPRKLAFGTDFVMQPVWHPSGDRLAYIAWNHPEMPWDGTELRLLNLATDGDGVPYNDEFDVIAGNTTTAIFQPEFSPDGRYLSYISDETDWGQLYLYDMTDGTHHAITSGEVEHAAPGWVQGIRNYAWSADGGGLYYLRNEGGFFSLWHYDLQRDYHQMVAGLEEYTYLAQPAVSPTSDTLALVASSPIIPARIITLQPPGDMDVPTHIAPPEGTLPGSTVIIDEKPLGRVHRRSSRERFTPEQLANAEAITWSGHDGEAVHGLYYAPANEQFLGTSTPPLLVYVHGGPTSQVTAAYNGIAQYFATRGYAVLQVNYRGSTGYGKTYMNMLRGKWGVYDVEDSASGATYLAEQGLADAGKFVIMGGSAGGYTTLQSLVDKPGFYAAGVCLYGVSNQFLLVQDTHKFEERYSESLLGALPEAAPVYRDRSPIFSAENISDPIIIFQGAEDVVVPQNQSDLIVESLRERGVPNEYHIYDGEGHGFRKPETIEHYLNATIKFLTQYVIYK